MGSRSSPRRPTVSPQPPPPDRTGRHQDLAIAHRSDAADPSDAEATLSSAVRRSKSRVFLAGSLITWGRGGAIRDDPMGSDLAPCEGGILASLHFRATGKACGS